MLPHQGGLKSNHSCSLDLSAYLTVNCIGEAKPLSCNVGVILEVSRMIKEKEIWLDDEKRKQQLDRSANNAESTFFGFQRVPRERKADRVLQHFNSVAQHYDFMNTLLSFGIHHLWKRSAIRMLNLAPGDHVLDVCGGTGDLAILAARHLGPDGGVIIYDINRAMIQAGLHKVSHKNIEDRIRYVQGDAESISFPDRHFEAAMVGFGIRNVTNVKKGFEEMYRVLKPGGRMMCLEFSKPTFAPFRKVYFPNPFACFQCPMSFRNC